MNATLSTAGGDKFCELTTSLMATVFQALKRLTQVLGEICRIIISLMPSWGPNREVTQEGGWRSLFLDPLPLEGGVWMNVKCHSGLLRNGVVTCNRRNFPWPTSGRLFEKWEKLNSSRRKVLCNVRMERLESVRKCWRKKKPYFSFQPVVSHYLGGWCSWPRDTPKSYACLIFTFAVSPQRENTQT